MAWTQRPWLVQERPAAVPPETTRGWRDEFGRSEGDPRGEEVWIPGGGGPWKTRKLGRTGGGSGMRGPWHVGSLSRLPAPQKEGVEGQDDAIEARIS